MKLTENWEIKKSGDSFTLVERFESKSIKSKTGYGYREFHSGTLYQALQGFLVRASQEEKEIDNIALKIGNILFELENAKETIRREFRTEVRVSK